MSFIDKLEQVVYLQYVLKVLGIVLLALGFVAGWHSLGWLPKFLFFAGPLAWYVGARFDKIYH